MPVSLIFLLCGLLCGLVLVRTVKGVRSRLQIIAVVVVFAAALALAAALFTPA